MGQGHRVATVRHPRLRSFRTSQPQWQRKFDAALERLAENVRVVPGADEPVLIEGGVYQGIWLESGPIDAKAYAPINPQPYLAAHRLFIQHQKPDGQIPCFVRRSGIGWSQVQTVTSLAVTALDCATHFGDDDLLARAYEACSRWDAWLARYRDRRGLNLCEAFCEYDTGHDKSPRWQGLPKVCAEKDARLCPDDPRLPYLAPDLSASLYGGRVALAEMAQRLGRADEAAAWLTKAQATRQALFEHCFDPETLCFYDRDGQGRFVRMVGDVLLRVLAEGVVDAELAEATFARWVFNPKAFWTTCPLPSIATNDPSFDWSMPGNSWGGPAQALTALRAPLFLERYGKYAQLNEVMVRWLRAIVASDGFLHQANPLTGEFIANDGYTPTMCVMLDYLLRLQGISLFERSFLSWGCWYDDSTHERDCVFTCEQGEARLDGRGSRTDLHWQGRRIARITGCVRVITDLDGRVVRLVGIQEDPAAIEVELEDASPRRFMLAPNQIVDLSAAPKLREGQVPA